MKLAESGGVEGCASWLELEMGANVEARMGGSAEYRTRSFGRLTTAGARRYRRDILGDGRDDPSLFLRPHVFWSMVGLVVPCHRDELGREQVGGADQIPRLAARWRLAPRQGLPQTGLRPGHQTQNAAVPTAPRPTARPRPSSPSCYASGPRQAVLRERPAPGGASQPAQILQSAQTPHRLEGSPPMTVLVNKIGGKYS